MHAAIAIFSNLLVQLPVILVWLVGVILSLSYWRRHPKVSRFTLIAIAVLFVESLAGTYLSLYLPLTLSERGWNSGRLGILLSTVGFARALVRAVSWGLLLAAIFARRDE
jgi:hypothetical protein